MPPRTFVEKGVMALGGAGAALLFCAIVWGVTQALGWDYGLVLTVFVLLDGARIGWRG